MYLFGASPCYLQNNIKYPRFRVGSRLSVYQMFVCLEVMAHRQLRYVVGEREQKGLNYTLRVAFYVGFRNFRKNQH